MDKFVKTKSKENYTKQCILADKGVSYGGDGATLYVDTGIE